MPFISFTDIFAQIHVIFDFLSSVNTAQVVVSQETKEISMALV